MIEVLFTKLDAGAALPFNAYPGDAGWDLHVLGDHTVESGEWKDLPSGIALAVPVGFYARVVGRSSALRKKGLLVVEGVVDCGYRGEQLTCVLNVNDHKMVVHDGDSLAQIVVSPVPDVSWVEVAGVTGLPKSERGLSGYGSSGR